MLHDKSVAAAERQANDRLNIFAFFIQIFLSGCNFYLMDDFRLEAVQYSRIT